MSSFRRDALLVGATIIATLMLTSLPFQVRTTSGRTKMRGENAFVLNVGLTFRTEATASELMAEWSKIADYCYKHEPFLFAYEFARSDKKDNVYVVTERYRSKEDYLKAHKSSAAFLAFRPVMRRMQDAGDVVVTGDSFVELGLGFT